MNLHKAWVVAGCVSVIGGTVGCSTASSSRRPVYSASQVGQMISEQQGEVIGVQDVVIQAPTSRSGSAGAGSQIGSAVVGAAITGSPIQAAAAAGRVLGGIAGAGADNRNGEEITVLLKDGRTVVVVQERGATPFSIGDRVKILSGAGNSVYGGGNTRVVRDEVVTRSF